MPALEDPPPEDDTKPKLGWWLSFAFVLVPAAVLYALAATVMGD